MPVYLEKLTLPCLVPAIIALLLGRRVYYFEVGRVFLKLPIVGKRILGLFNEAEYQVSEIPGVNYTINSAALQAAEELHQQFLDPGSTAFWLWRRAFPSDRISLYVKKSIAGEAWRLIRDYLILNHWVQNGQAGLRFKVQDNALNRRLVPFLQRQYPEPGIKIYGLGHTPWRQVNHLAVVVLETCEFLTRLLGNIAQRGLSFRSEKRRYKLSKELVWGIGTGRRTDDFMVDDEEITSDEALFYYRYTTSSRLGAPEGLGQVIINARELGYQCVNFDRVPLSVGLFMKVIVPKYLTFPLLMLVMVITSGTLLNHFVLSFLLRTSGWEIFLASYATRLNLSQDEPLAGHIADTVVMNLNGCLNGGFQWSDMTTYRAVTSAYLGYNIYFVWGPLSEKFWQGNWQVDQFVHTGYLWGHNYHESREQTAALKSKLLGADPERWRVISLFDENPHRDVYQSKKMIYDFYKIGVQLLEDRPDTIVIAKPKSQNGVPDIPKVQELIAPYVESGRMRICGRQETDLWEVVAVSNATISLVMGTPFLEAMCCGKPGFSYAPTKNESSPIYSRGYNTAVFNDANQLVEAVNEALDCPDSDPWSKLQDLANDIDPYRDFDGVDRMRRAINDLTRSEVNQ